MKKQIAVAALTLALALPAMSVRADDNSRTKGTVIGAAAGALVTHSVGGAIVGGAIGNGIAYAGHRHRVYYYRHHHRYYHWVRN